MLADCGHEVKGFSDLRLVHVKWMFGLRHGVKTYEVCPACYEHRRKAGEILETLEQFSYWLKLPYEPSNPGKCPMCNNEDPDDISQGDWLQEETYAWREYTCHQCGFMWQEVFMLSHIEDPDANVLNDKGEVVIPKQIISAKGETK